MHDPLPQPKGLKGPQAQSPKSRNCSLEVFFVFWVEQEPALDKKKKKRVHRRRQKFTESSKPQLSDRGMRWPLSSAELRQCGPLDKSVLYSTRTHPDNPAIV